jgi:nicotinate-nucleotide pyrophosphorylase (carboxylating)
MASDILNDSRISRIVELALIEDIGLGDITTDAIVPDSLHGTGGFMCKQDGVVAGLEIAALVFQHCGPGVALSTAMEDGQQVKAGELLGRVEGEVRNILSGERTALNFLQRMSGIATLTRRYVEAISGTGSKITDTRKTAPGLRALDKWAVRMGGGVNHRFGLDDMVLIKDNHIVAAGGITRAVEKCVSYLREEDRNVAVEVETKNTAEVGEVLRCNGVKRVMLDNFAIPEMKKAVDLIAHRLEVEASGGITLDNVRAVAETGVDFISIGALTHSVKALDISLEITRTQK